jgi:hypothetical protein
MAARVQPQSDRLARHRSASASSYLPVTSSLYYDPYRTTPAMVYGGTGAPALVAMPGLSTPQYYTPYATRPTHVAPTWGAPMYIDEQDPYYAPVPVVRHRPSRHRRSPSPPPLAASEWDDPEGYRYAQSEPLRPWPHTVYHKPAMASKPPKQPLPSAMRKPRPLSRPKMSSASPEPEGLDDCIPKWAVGDYCAQSFGSSPTRLLRPFITRRTCAWPFHSLHCSARVLDKPYAAASSSRGGRKQRYDLEYIVSRLLCPSSS